MAFPKKISELPASGVLKNTDLFVTVNNDITSKTTLGEIAASISGGSSTFTGNTSATCINQLWVHSMSGCSPIQMGEIVVNGETTFNGNVNLSPDSQTNIDFDNADTVSIPTYVLKDCKGNENDITTLQNFSAYVGQIVTLLTEGVTKWEVTLQPTFEVTSVEECCFENYILTNCITSEVWGIVSGQVWDGSSWIGTIITMKNDFEVGCYSVAATCNEWDYEEPITVMDEFVTCEACTAVTITYTLTPCDGWMEDPINTTTDLSAYVGGVVSIKEEETGICYTVQECTVDCETSTIIGYEEFIGGCISCKDNWELTGCFGDIIGTTTQQSDLWEPFTVFSATNIDTCFTVDKVSQGATLGGIEDIGEVIDCETVPCINYALFNCDGELLGITNQNLSEFEGLYYSGSNITQSFSGQCFTIETFPEPADLGPLDTSDWGEVECDQPPCKVTYRLDGCDGLTQFYTTTNMSEYVGSYIHAETDPPQAITCFYVTQEDGESTYEVGEPQAIYTEDEGCDCCGQNPKWKYSACDDETDQIVWENTALGPLGIYAPPACVRISTDEGETWKCYNFMLCVPAEIPTIGITNFEVLADEECCEGESCI